MDFEVWTKGLATLAVDCLVLGDIRRGRAERRGAQPSTAPAADA